MAGHAGLILARVVVRSYQIIVHGFVSLPLGREIECAVLRITVALGFGYWVAVLTFWEQPRMVAITTDSVIDVTETAPICIVTSQVGRACRHALDFSLDLIMAFPAFLGARIVFPVMAAGNIEGEHGNHCYESHAKYHDEQQMKPCYPHLNYPLDQWKAN